MDGMIPTSDQVDDEYNPVKKRKQEVEVIDVYKWCGAAVLNMIGLGGT